MRNRADEPALTASMGPRLFSRGKHGVGGHQSAIGTRFNGASAFQPRKVAIIVKLRS